MATSEVDVLGGAYKGHGHPVHLLFDSEEQVVPVLVSEYGLVNGDAGQINSLEGRHHARTEGSAVDVGWSYLSHFKLDSPVSDENEVAHLQVAKDARLREGQ